MVKKTSIKKKVVPSKVASRNMATRNKVNKKKAKTKSASTWSHRFGSKFWFFTLGSLVLGGIVITASYQWLLKQNYISAINTKESIAGILPQKRTQESKNESEVDTDFMPIRVLELEGTLINITRDEIVAKLIKQTNNLDSVTDDTRESDESVIGFFDSDLTLLEERLESIPWLQSAELRRVWPDRLHIKIKEQRAIARWNEKDLINAYGDVFQPENLQGHENLPQLIGPDTELEQMLLTFTKLQSLIESIGLQLENLTLNHRYSWSLELANGIKLQVGREHLMQRVERFITLYPLLKRESKLPIGKVDLRYDTGLAVTRLETSELQASL